MNDNETTRKALEHYRTRGIRKEAPENPVLWAKIVQTLTKPGSKES